MSDWKVTAGTFSCRAVADEFTIIVKNDWSVQCSGFDKLKNSRRAQLQMVERSLDLKRTLDCKGMQCKQITDYLEKLQAEENPKSTSVPLGRVFYDTQL
jgi:hypothetical protein